MNAIILAAGVGHRMINLTRQLNKALLPVGGVPIIERIILYLHQAGVEDITIVTGHKQELFLPLAKKYKAKIIRNKKYSVYNVLYSLQLALDHLEDTLLIHGDVILFKNLFQPAYEKTTLYTTYKNTKGVPIIEIHPDGKHHLTGFSQSSTDKMVCTHLGITYIGAPEAQLIKRYYKEQITTKKLKDYKGELDTELFPLLEGRDILIRHVDSRYAMDINLMEEYYQACIKYESYWKES